MSRDIKYIGMDVHKEAIVIAVLNGSGKLVMESVIETHANSILQWSNIDENTTQYREHLLDQPFASGLPAICALPFFLRHLPGV